MSGIRDYMVKLAQKQITIAFDQSEKEAADIVLRVKEGLTLSDKKGGATIGNTHNKKVVPVADIKAHSNVFNGTLNNVPLAKMLGVSSPTVDKWIKEVEAA